MMPSHFTPSKSSSSRATPKGSQSGQSSTLVFTAQMQDRQARNKDPYSSSDESDSGWEGPGSKYDAYGNDSYASMQLRRDAAIKLDNPELVMMLAQSRNDSIPATRHYLTKIMCGYLTQEDIDAEASGEKRKELEPIKPKAYSPKSGRPSKK